jgi:nanoRNase/pAp phosphatase (c-di-AMP/oligoRNAs hydrolase)
MADTTTYRLVTRSDFDGLISAVLLKSRGLIDDVLFVHPKDVQDGKIPISARDITTNLPYVPECHLCFDHHASEVTRIAGTEKGNLVLDPHAPSAARVVWNHFGGAAAFPAISDEMMDAVDKADSAEFTMDEVLAAQGWVLLSFLVDSRTGLGRFREFTISNYALMMELVEYCRRDTAEQALARPHVAERVQVYREHEAKFKDQVKRCTKVHGKLAVYDLRNEETIYAGNRFVLYALFPQCNISATVMWGLRRQNTVIAIGKSIFDRSSKTNVGELCLAYGGGGHVAAGTCQPPTDQADRVLAEIVARINKDG